MSQLRWPGRAELQIAVLDCAVMGTACLLTYWLVTIVQPHVYTTSRAAGQIGALWAVISTVFVLRDSYQHSTAAALSRMAATSVSFVLCLIYLVFLPFHSWALGLLIGASALAVTLLGRPGDAVSAGISSAVVMIAARLSPQHAWEQPVLRFIDTVVGVIIGVAAAWLALRVIRPRLPQHQGGPATAD
ncbi:MAG TPA: FUSC family protein [Streptosporangiaceae bacterium]|nr:FUSC family protein [Streptosporangiaceae bacterium]